MNVTNKLANKINERVKRLIIPDPASKEANYGNTTAHLVAEFARIPIGGVGILANSATRCAVELLHFHHLELKAADALVELSRNDAVDAIGLRSEDQSRVGEAAGVVVEGELFAARIFDAQ